MGERRPSGVLSKLFGKDSEQEDSEYVQLPSPKSEKQREQPPAQKTRSFRLSFLKSSREGSNGADEDEAAQYRRFSARDEDAKTDHMQERGRAHGYKEGNGADVSNSELQLVLHSAAGSAQATQQDQQEAELSIPQAIKQKASRWLERFRSQSAAAPPSSPLSEGQPAYTSVHHVKASRYIDQSTLQSLSVAKASIAADQRALVLASQPSSEGLWRERGKLAGLRAQRDGWVQKRDGLLEQLRLAEEKHASLKQQVQHRIIAERSAELKRQQQQLQQVRTGVETAVDELQDGLTSTMQAVKATPDDVDETIEEAEAEEQETGDDEAGDEEVKEERDEKADETGYMAAPDGLEPSGCCLEDDQAHEDTDDAR